MARSTKAGFLGFLILAGSASATSLGPIRGSPVTGRPLEVNIPFAVDRPTDRACASAKVRYGKVPVPGAILDVQGQGLKRNLLVTSRASVNQQTVTVDVRVGCGPKAVARTFTLPTNMSAAKGPPVTGRPTRQAASDLAIMSGPKAMVSLASREPLFPPPAEAAPAPGHAQDADLATTEALRQAQAEAASAMAQLEAVRRELAAVLDVERRTSQTLIDADHEVRDAKSQVARMRLALSLVGTALALVAAGVVWFEFHRVVGRRRTRSERPAKEPTILPTPEEPPEGKPLLA